MVRVRASVASFTDAWIETLNNSRVFIQLPVASFTDAWIETQAGLATCFGNSSHLLQMRGLKHESTCQLRLYYQVASFTDAWIETLIAKTPVHWIVVASFTDAWIETSS